MNYDGLLNECEKLAQDCFRLDVSAVDAPGFGIEVVGAVAYVLHQTEATTAETDLDDTPGN